ncbi:3-hydroxy-3-methylglutaryl-CoA reductase, partial [Streptococcus suis]
MSTFSGFYKKSRQERIDSLRQNRSLSADSLDVLYKDENLPEAIAGKMAENQLGTFSLPF